ncbi:MAG: esterase-like activity of phytase family protein [Rubritepida sp.]|nr:esterase-like activity of phytase family protein [Rubritepida sp.]
MVPLGGLVLDTSAWGFGGFSALHLDAGGLTSAVSDRGRWWQARLLRDAAGRPTGFAPARHGPLRDATGAPLRGRLGDAEALARLADGSWLIGFERAHRLQRHATLDAPGAPFPAPPGLDEAPPNAGVEGVTQLADGRLLLLTEGLPGPEPGSRAAWIGALEGARVAWTRRAYLPDGGLEPTDVAALPDGGALVLERDYTLLGGFRARLGRIAPAALRGAQPIRATTLLELPGDGPSENWEGVAVQPTPEGLLVALVSDDNERPAQRTLFLLYRLG